MNLPKHIELSIRHNPHAGDYETVERWLELNEVRDQTEISPEDRAEILRTKEVWVITWCPRTPVGSCTVAAASLARALELAADDPETSPAPDPEPTLDRLEAIVESEIDRMHRAADAEFSEIAARHEQLRVAIAAAAMERLTNGTSSPQVVLDLDLNRLDAVARAAWCYPWKVSRSNGTITAVQPGDHCVTVASAVNIDEEFSRIDMREEDAVYLETFPPPVVRRLIAMARGATPVTSGPPIAVNLHRAIVDSISVLESARALAANEFLGPDDGALGAAIVDLKEQVRAAVRAFGGGGPEGIGRASGRLVEMRAMAGITKQLCDALAEALQGWEDNTRWDTQYPSWERDPACARIVELRKFLGPGPGAEHGPAPLPSLDAWTQLTDDERLHFLETHRCCRNCGSLDTGCQCDNDE